MQKIDAAISSTIEVHNTVGETPIWVEDQQALFWVNTNDEPEVLRWDRVSGRLDRWPMPERCGGMALKKSGGALVTLASGVFDLDFATRKLDLVAPSPLPKHVALHECGCDPAGRLWVGSINLRATPDNGTPGEGAFFRLEGNKLIQAIDDNITCSNGLAFSPDGRKLYLSDSPTHRCDVWDLNPDTAELSNRRPFFRLDPGKGFIDGAAVDAEGFYWVCIVYTGEIRKYSPDGCQVLSIALPFENPTNIAFGGPRLQTMYVTTTAERSRFAPPDMSSLNGAVHAFDFGVSGYAEAKVNA